MRKACEARCETMRGCARKCTMPCEGSIRCEAVHGNAQCLRSSRRCEAVRGNVRSLQWLDAMRWGCIVRGDSARLCGVMRGAGGPARLLHCVTGTMSTGCDVISGSVLRVEMRRTVGTLRRVQGATSLRCKVRRLRAFVMLCVELRQSFSRKT